MLRDRIARFIASPQGDSFEALALEAHAHQYGHVEPFRRLCDTQGRAPGQVTDWRQVPLVPTLAFKTLALHGDPPVETFRSSGTLGQPSVHHHPYPDLYLAAVDHSFPAACLRGLERPPMLALIPSRQQAPDSSLSFMVEHVVARHGGEPSAIAMGPRGVDVPAARSWLGARQRDHRPAVVLTTSLALAQLLDALERRYLHFRLAPGSVLFETGGSKGQSIEVDPAAQAGRAAEFLGIQVSQIVREYGMTELSSQAYAVGSDLYSTPHWMRSRVLDPETLEDATEGSTGILAFFDLANLGSACSVATEDLGTAQGDGFRLVGRADGAELRGCSLTAEALATSAVGSR